MTSLPRTAARLTLIGLLAIAPAACAKFWNDPKGTIEQGAKDAGHAVGQAAEDTKEGAKKAGKTIGEGIETGLEKTGDAFKKAGEKTGEAVDSIGK